MPSVQRKPFKTILLSVLIGVAAGTLVGELLGIILPAGIPRDVLTWSTEYVLEPFRLNLLVVSVTLGFSVTFNLLSLLGVFVAIQLLKWSW